MNHGLIFSSFLCGAAIIVGVPFMVAPEYVANYGPVTVIDSSQAVLLCSVLASIIGVITFHSGTHGKFLLQLFLVALLIRVLVGSGIFTFSGQGFFGGDAYTYDFFGHLQMQAWNGDTYAANIVNEYLSKLGAAWGMIDFVAAIYEIVGRNMLAVQLVNCALGAATVPIIFHCAYLVTNNTRVARIAALAVAFMPSLVLWSSQGLKDGPIMFLLALAILATLKLQERFRLKYLVVLLCTLLAVLAFRFYVFYMLAAAIGGSFFVGMGSGTTLIREYVVIILLAPSLAYVGSTGYTNQQFNQFASLQAVQTSRMDASKEAKSGFGKDYDVSTTSGAVAVIPLGLAYLLFAPFPWQLGSIRQIVAAPEMLLWWGSFPMLILGLAYLIRYRLRQASPIIIFTMMLSLAYSVFQGNVGNAYRERAQLLIFYFIFAAVGWVVFYDRRRTLNR
jgi:4-amino-4-deoxy-L-arabinose transferase-like glycosyltransferase